MRRYGARSFLKPIVEYYRRTSESSKIVCVLSEYLTPNIKPAFSPVCFSLLTNFRTRYYVLERKKVGRGEENEERLDDECCHRGRK